MNRIENISTQMRRLWKATSQRRRKQFFILLVLMILASFAEIISIGAVLPFLAVLTAPDRLFNNPAFEPVIKMLRLTEAHQLLLPLTLIFAVTVFFSGALRLLMLWVSTRLSFAMGADISIGIYRRTLYQPYAVHISRNSSEIINSISTKANSVINYAIIPLLTLISSSTMLVIIVLALFAFDPIIALSVFGGFGFIYATILGITSRKQLADSRCIARESTQVIKSLQEGLGGIRDVLINGSQAAYCQLYQNADIPLRKAQGNNFFISNSPRYGIEPLGILLIAVLAYILALQPNGIVRTIPVLGALALGAQRLLPVMQQAYASWSNVQGGWGSLLDVLELLDQPLPDDVDRQIVKPLSFNNQIELKNLSFRYGSQGPWVLRNLDYTIPKGSRVGFIGPTGSGKSTLLDIIMGLLPATEGAIMVDGEPVTTSTLSAWQDHIAHVPQSIFLADSTIEENIAFGVPRDAIDHVRVKEAALQAQIAETIETWPKKYQTFVGERGIRLSGGQRQRIGIARALYKKADVIIFDEATSALDNETEEAVMQSIEALSGKLTILIIAHRLSTLKNCTQIVELGNIGIRRNGSYQEIVSTKNIIPNKFITN